MDVLNLLTNKDRISYTNNFNYKTKFMLDDWFPSMKTDNMQLAITRLIENGNIPRIALIHALDSEARIGDRDNYKKLEVEKLYIKEKLNQGERIDEYLNGVTDEDTIRDLIYDDFGTLISRVLTRAELMRNQLLSTGQIVVDENNVKNAVDFGYDKSHNDSFSDWSNPEHDIIADLNAIIKKAKKSGYTITRALTSETILSYITLNSAINKIFIDSGNIPTEARIVNWLYDNFNIQFATNDDLYKETDGGQVKTHRFFPENKITFIAGNEVLGNTIYGKTPEELSYEEAENRGYVTISQWKTPDPVTTWSKASALVLPVMNDIDRLFIVTVSK